MLRCDDVPIDEILNKFEAVNDAADSLNTTATSYLSLSQTLNSSINTLNSKISTWSSKLVAPEDTEDVVTGYATAFGLIDTGESYAVNGGATQGPISHDGSYFYSVSSAGTSVVRWKPSDASFSTIIASLPSGSSGFAICYDTVNDLLYVAQAPAYSSDKDQVWVYDASDWSLNNTITVQKPSSINYLGINGLAHDNNNDEIYIAIGDYTPVII